VRFSLAFLARVCDDTAYRTNLLPEKPMKSSLTIALSIAVLGLTNARVHAQPTLESRWADLASPDEGKATRALLALAATPKETTAFLKDHLKPVKADAKRVEQLLKSLDSTNYAARVQATTELEYYGKYIKNDLEAALKSATQSETKTRIQQLLDKIPKDKKAEPPPAPMKGRPGSSVSVMNVNGKITILVDGKPIDMAQAAPPPPPGPPQTWLRAVKAVAILEHLNTPESQQLLQSIAAGEPDALPTTAAREALVRLKKQ
jgi:hypothetical protein